MVDSDYKDLFVVIATAAATLIGLLFVAMSVSKGRSRNHPQVIREFRAAAALLAFTNAFSVSMFGLVPGTDVGFPSAIIGVTGVLFVAAGVRTTLSLPSELQHRRPQLALAVGLLAVFGLQIVFGVQLILNTHRTGTLAGIGYVLIASLLIGIGRSWELVGEWDTGLFASLTRLFGNPSETSAPADAPSDDS
jgi:hypothetical protein